MNNLTHTLTEMFMWISYFNAAVLLPTTIVKTYKATSKIVHRIRNPQLQH